MLRVATASDAAALLDEMGTVMRQRDRLRLKRASHLCLIRSADDIISHMSAYMETATP